jgi:hypothetical protein
MQIVHCPGSPRFLPDEARRSIPFIPENLIHRAWQFVICMVTGCTMVAVFFMPLTLGIVA